MLKVGDKCLFDGSGAYHFDIPHQAEVKITRVGKSYTYPGMGGATCQEIDFEVVETGKKFERFSSQWVDKVEV